jgi:hypothetical protein
MIMAAVMSLSLEACINVVVVIVDEMTYPQQSNDSKIMRVMMIMMVIMVSGVSDAPPANAHLR